MKSSNNKTENKEKEKEKNVNNQNEDISEASDENSENGEQEDDATSKVNLASFITTPYERVLSIINEAKTFILSVTKEQQTLVKGLEWAIKIISSHSLYSYELKDQDYLNQVSEENPDFKQFVDFVNSYNDEVIQMNKKINMIGGKSFQKSSLNLKRTQIPKYSNSPTEENKAPENETPKKQQKNNDNNVKEDKNKNIISNNNNVIKEQNKTDYKAKNKKLKSSNKNVKGDKTDKPSAKNIVIKQRKNNSSSCIVEIKNNEKNNNEDSDKNNIKIKKRLIRNKTNEFHTSQKQNNNTGNRRMNSQKIDYPNNSLLHKSFEGAPKPNPVNEIYPTSRILEKTFNIFELKEIVGQDRVLPIMGRVILDAFGLDTDEIISREKLEPFLVSISNQYLKTTLYHNSLHGADVTQSVCLYFLNSNAEEISQSLVLDLLGILIAALGHDLGHPGLTNPFHINASTEFAITYNDASCLENFHVSSLFRTIRKTETNIFEKLSVQDYKTIRKRMIGNILATDMANHGKIMTVIKSRISINMAENKKKFELLSGNEKSKFEEQQSLFDFLLHAADLSHNCKLFNISLKWVELLSEEFWLQGDKEKSMNLPVSFLCDRDSYNIPKSQVGFIKGFIIPTFDCLINIFPSLKFALDNAKTNLNKWQRLANKGRLRGWTPGKTKQINYKKKVILYNAISSYGGDSNNSNNKPLNKRKIGKVNSLSHELQVKEVDNREEADKSAADKKNGKNKIIKPNIITKKKNHDKKVHINKFSKIK